MTDASDREEILRRLRRDQEELKAVNEKLVTSALRYKELLEHTEAILTETRASRSRLLSMVESVVEEVWYCDTRGVVSPMNPAAHGLLRLARSDNGPLPIQKWLSRLEPRDQDGVLLAPDDTPLMRSLRGETVKEFREFVWAPLTSRVLVRDINSAPVRDEEGEIVGAVAVVRNVA